MGARKLEDNINQYYWHFALHIGLSTLCISLIKRKKKKKKKGIKGSICLKLSYRMILVKLKKVMPWGRIQGVFKLVLMVPTV